MFTIFNPISSISFDRQDDDSDEINRKRELYKRQAKARSMQAKEREAARFTFTEENSSSDGKAGVLKNFQYSPRRQSTMPRPASVKQDLNAELHVDHLFIGQSENILVKKEKFPNVGNQGLDDELKKALPAQAAEDGEVSEIFSSRVPTQSDLMFRESQFNEFDLLKNIDDKLNSDIFFSDSDSLIKTLNELCCNFLKNSNRRLASGRPDTGGQKNEISHDGLHSTLNFLEGYFEKDFSSHADREIFKHTLDEFRSAIEHDRSLMVRDPMGGMVGGSTPELLQKSLEANQNAAVTGYSSSRRRMFDNNDSEIVLSTALEASSQLAKDSSLAEFLNERELKISRKNKENSDATLPLIVQRSV